MELFPAVDLRARRAVRLVQGDFDRSTDYGDPVALAEDFVRRGARWLHVVDLDAAKRGSSDQRDLVVAIARTVSVPVQTGGGVRRAADVDELLEAGLARVVLGTAATEDPTAAAELAAQHPDRVALGLDYRRRPDRRLEVAGRGWTAPSGRSVAEVLAAVGDASFGAVVVTAIDRDGTLSGPDIDGLTEVLEATAVPVVASGGVGSAADLVALAGLVAPRSGRRLAGAVVGRALVDGRVSVEEALEACASSV
jgi:phosphoribosylformimino-5-aminoimidazole carboxamide ribotide isomerase